VCGAETIALKKDEPWVMKFDLNKPVEKVIGLNQLQNLFEVIEVFGS
jgi:hypothetical protein